MMKRLVLWFLLALLILLVGCAKPEILTPTKLTQTYTSPTGFINNGIGFSISYPQDWSIGEIDEIAYNDAKYVKMLLTSPYGFSLQPFKLWTDWNETPSPGYEQKFWSRYTAEIVFKMQDGGNLGVWYPERLTLDHIEAEVKQPSTSQYVTVKLIESKRIIINEKKALYTHRKLTDTTTGESTERIDIFIIPGVITGEADTRTDVFYTLVYVAVRPPFTENFEKYKTDALNIINSFKLIPPQ